MHFELSIRTIGFLFSSAFWSEYELSEQLQVTILHRFQKKFFYSYSFCPFSCTDHNVPLLSLRRDSPPKSSPTFSVQPRSSVGRVTVDLIRRSWVQFPPRSKEFFYLDRLVPWFPLLGLTPSGSFMGSTTLILLPNCCVIYHQFL